MCVSGEGSSETKNLRESLLAIYIDYPPNNTEIKIVPCLNGNFWVYSRAFSIWQGINHDGNYGIIRV